MKQKAVMIDLRDERVLRELFGRFYARACVFAGRFLPDGMLAADLVQEAFLYMWQHVPVLTDETALPPDLATASEPCATFASEHREQVTDEDEPQLLRG